MSDGPRSEHAQRVAADLIGQIKAGTAPWMKPWEAGADCLPRSGRSGQPYRGFNGVWLMSRAFASGYSDNRWFTMLQANKMGAHVRKGEHGTTIEFFSYHDERPVIDPQTGRYKRDQTGEVVKERVERESPAIRRYTVFNAEQLEGIPPAPTRGPLAAWERHGRAETLLASSAAVIRHVRGDGACYEPHADRITMPERDQFPSPDGYYGTAFHELGHWTGHETRLDRKFGARGTEEYAREELRAEIASLMLGVELGIGHQPREAAAYTAFWVKKLQDEPREIFRAAADAEKIRAFVLGFERKREQEQSIEQVVTTPTLVDRAAPESGMTKGELRFFHAPYSDRAAIKAAAKAARVRARWNPEVKAWEIPASADPKPFERWINAPTRTVDPVAEFAEAVHAAGLRLEGPPAETTNGKPMRVAVEGDRPGQKSGAYTLHLDGHPAGYIQNFKTGYDEKWKSSAPTPKVTPEERERQKREWAEKQARKAAEMEEQYRAAAIRAEVRWRAARPLAAAAAHPYLEKKGVPAMGGIRVEGRGILLLPIHDAGGKLQSLERIFPDGVKKGFPGGKKEGGRLVLNSEALAAATARGERSIILIAEGYATGATVARATECTTVVAFSAGNLEEVARSLRAKHPGAAIIIAGDDDRETAKKHGKNPGVEKAEAAAAAVNGIAWFPPFKSGQPGSDWNDYEQLVGRDGIREEMVRSLRFASDERGPGSETRTPAGGATSAEVRQEAPRRNVADVELAR
jgi:putative DNA primase/helicase